MGLASQSSLTEAIAAARAGDRARARELLSKLLRADSANPEYWIWMSSVVESDREKVYCLESALKLDPTNRSALRGLVILGARNPQEQELASAIKIARRHTASAPVARPAKAAGGFQFPWRFVVMIALGLCGLAAMVQLLLLVSGPATTILAPVLAPVRTPSATPAPPTVTPTITLTPIPVETRILRTPVPFESGATPLAFLVEASPTPTTMLGVTPRPQYEAYANGIAALLRGDYEEVIASMREVADSEPGAADAWYFMGEANRALGRPGAAVEAYDRAVLAKPDFAPGYLGRARTLQSLRPDTLAVDYERAIQVDPLLAPAYLDMAAFYGSRRQWENADEVLGRGIAAGLTEPELFIRRAEAQLNRTFYSQGLENAIEGSANDPTNLLGYLVLGRAYVENELYNPALWPLQTYLIYEPDDPVGLVTLARAHLGVGQYDSAFEYANQALSINGRLSQAYVVRGYVQNFRGEYQEALKDFGQALRFGRSSWDVQYGKARSYFGLGQMAAAFNAANIALADAIEEEDFVIRDRKKGEAYALLAMIFEDFDPPRIDDALNNWGLLVVLEHAKPETIALARAHILELTGTGPTRTATVSPTPSLSPEPPTPTYTPTP